MKRFGLSEQDMIKKVSDTHMEKISRSYCSQWRSLYSYLEVDQIVVSDVDRMNSSQREKRCAFFTAWREKMGSDATYRSLVCALLKIGCQEDAECVCKLLSSTDSH